MLAASLETMNSSAPIAKAATRFPGDVEMATTVLHNAHGLGQSDAHLAQAADVDNADALAAASGLPGIERRVHSDARTEDWACGIAGLRIKTVRQKYFFFIREK